jgi:hypothetical protein
LERVLVSGRTASCPDTSGRIPAGEDGMDLEKDNFEDDNELKTTNWAAKWWKPRRKS